MRLAAAGGLRWWRWLKGGAPAPRTESPAKNYQVSVSATGATYTYDSNGNLTQNVEGADSWTYEWNAGNKLKRVLKNSIEQARFAYDPFGRRVEKVAGTVTTNWIYDGEDILRQVSGAATLKYIHGGATDEPLAT